MPLSLISSTTPEDWLVTVGFTAGVLTGDVNPGKLLRADGRLVPVTGNGAPARQDGDTTVLLMPRQPAAGSVSVQGRPAGQRVP